ncbi:MAG: adenosylcobinamide-phosphate synthase [Verrucomicrobiaceae bacterium]|nr:adenosylcobinamide-phosphate synthase [Verrucomicrobiaceae bacterium]
MFISLIILVVALVLDQLLGEPRRFHPLVGFGNIANRVERYLNRGDHWGEERYWRGVFAWVVMVAPPVIVAIVLHYFLLEFSPIISVLGEALIVYLALGRKSLIAHARAVYSKLQQFNMPGARRAVGLIVTRDTLALDENGVSTAAVESVLENGSDAIFASVFWFALAGIPGVVLHRAANTLDAMWGYRNERFEEFGWAAARFDDVLNYIPARFTAISYALCGQLKLALRSWYKQAPQWSSPNAGPVMAAGAGALAIRLGGAAIYHGESEERPQLGFGRPAQADDIQRALILLDRALMLWVAVLLLAAASNRWLF